MIADEYTPRIFVEVIGNDLKLLTKFRELAK